MPTKEPSWMQDIRAGKTKINNPDGSVSTMKSVTFEGDGKVYLAPSIRVIDGNPVDLGPDAAVQYARTQGDAMPFDTQEAADTFDKNFHEQEYKRLGVGASPKNQWPSSAIGFSPMSK